MQECVGMQKEADKEEERELTPDEIGRKIASQWTTDPDAAGSGDSSDPARKPLQEEDEAQDTSSGTEQADDVSPCARACCPSLQEVLRLCHQHCCVL